MGCDIHIALEQKVGDKWVMVNRLSGHAKERHYKRFAALAGVRGDGPEPKGIPADVSDSTKLFIDEWGADGHSHSWDTLPDAQRIYSTVFYADETPPKFPAYHYFDMYSDEPDLTKYRIVYFFDN